MASSLLFSPATTLAQDHAHSDGAFLSKYLPRVEYRAGAFVRRPRPITITFTADDPQIVSRLERFADTMTHTPWWRTVVGGYCAKADDCVGAGQPARAVRLSDVLPADVHAVELSAILRRLAAAGRLGQLDAEVLLLVYLPPAVRLRDAFVARYCGDGPRGFHRALRLDRLVIPYAVMPRCGDEAALTATASHELVEMALSPDPSAPAFAMAQSGQSPGFIAAGNEAMDPCGLITRETEVVESGFTVRRGWSNQAAARGQDPCVPASSDSVYAALVPEQGSVRLLDDGETAVLRLEAASSGPTASWAVSALDLTGSQERDVYVDVALDKATVAPGDTATLRITRRKAHRQGLSVVGIVSTVGGRSFLWPVAVLTR